MENARHPLPVLTSMSFHRVFDGLPRPILPFPQVKLFGSFTRWAQDVAPPLDGGAPGRSILTTAAAALRYATTSPAGPVHINMQVCDSGVCHNFHLAEGRTLLVNGTSWVTGRRPLPPRPQPPARCLCSDLSPASAVPRATRPQRLPLEPPPAAGGPRAMVTLPAALHTSHPTAQPSRRRCSRLFSPLLP